MSARKLTFDLFKKNIKIVLFNQNIKNRKYFSSPVSEYTFKNYNF